MSLIIKNFLYGGKIFRRQASFINPKRFQKRVSSFILLIFFAKRKTPKDTKYSFYLQYADFMTINWRATGDSNADYPD